MRRRHSSHSCKSAAARMAVKGAPFLGAFIGAKRRPLTATAAEATRGASRARVIAEQKISQRLRNLAQRRDAHRPRKICMCGTCRFLTLHSFSTKNDGDAAAALCSTNTKPQIDATDRPASSRATRSPGKSTPPKTGTFLRAHSGINEHRGNVDICSQAVARYFASALNVTTLRATFPHKVPEVVCSL